MTAITWRVAMVEAEGDGLAILERLLRAEYGAAFRLANAMLRDRSTAEDAVQTAAIRAWRSLSRSSEVTNQRAWFLAIVANECRSIRRRRWWSVLRRPDLPSSVAPPASEAAMDIREALGQ